MVKMILLVYQMHILSSEIVCTHSCHKIDTEIIKKTFLDNLEV